MTASPRGLHLWLGADRARKREQIAELQRTLRAGPLDRHDLDGASAQAAELAALGRQQPAQALARLIVVDRADRLEARGVEALLQHAAAIAQTACMVLLIDGELSVRHPLSRAAQEGLVAVSRFAGTEPPGGAKPFVLLDAVGARDLSAALQALRDQQLTGREPVEVLGLLGWQLQRWVAVRRFLDAQMPPARIAALVGLKPWQVDRIRGDVSRRSLEDLQGALARCWAVDAAVKQGRAVPWLAIEELLFELCGPLRDVPRSRGGRGGVSRDG